MTRSDKICHLIKDHYRDSVWEDYDFNKQNGVLFMSDEFSVILEGWNYICDRKELDLSKKDKIIVNLDEINTNKQFLSFLRSLEKPNERFLICFHLFISMGGIQSTEWKETTGDLTERKYNIVKTLLYNLDNSNDNFEDEEDNKTNEERKKKWQR